MTDLTSYRIVIDGGGVVLRKVARVSDNARRPYRRDAVASKRMQARRMRA